MKNKFLFLLFFVVISSEVIVYSQNVSSNSNVRQLRGRVINPEDEPVVFAHVVNIRRKYATITDSLGFFKMLVMEKDTIRITAIGFQTRFIEIAGKVFNDTSVQVMKIEKRTYDLPTVNIYELRWQVFKSEFMETKVEDDKTAQRITNWMANLVPSDELRMIFQGSRGPGFSINYKTKAEKSKIKVAKMERKYALIAPKFNDKLITNLTGLEGKEIYKFLQFCNFSEEFLIQSTEYEIIEEILIRWEEYKKRAPKK